MPRHIPALSRERRPGQRRREGERRRNLSFPPKSLAGHLSTSEPFRMNYEFDILFCPLSATCLSETTTGQPVKKHHKHSRCFVQQRSLRPGCNRCSSSLCRRIVKGQVPFIGSKEILFPVEEATGRDPCFRPPMVSLPPTAKYDNHMNPNGQ
jgi:hypothetical protein